ncbi:MAG: hypothetical protein M3Y74_08205 [Chloroflexota bacterium]|nr:hypothetical protein [Chloroflexota bacterium]
MKSDDALYRAMKTGRLKTVTTMVGPRVVRLTTQAWLDTYLVSRNVPLQSQDEMTP